MKTNMQRIGKPVPKIELTEEEIQKCMADVKLKLENIDINETQTLARLDTGKTFTNKRNKKKKKKRREGLVQERIISVRLFFYNNFSRICKTFFLYTFGFIYTFGQKTSVHSSVLQMVLKISKIFLRILDSWGKNLINIITFPTL